MPTLKETIPIPTAPSEARLPMKLSAEGLAFIKAFESFVPHVYDDLVPPVRGAYREFDPITDKVRGTLTIGYGHTDAARHPLRVTPGLRITEAQAMAILDMDLDECEEAVNRLVKVPITQGQFDALVSFTFNCGIGNLKKLVVPLNRGDAAGTYAKFDQFIRSKGQVLKGLIRRRDGEQALWLSTPRALPTAEEVVNVPEKVDAPRQPVTPKGVAAGVAASGAALALVKQSADAVSSVAEPLRETAASISGAVGGAGSVTVLLLLLLAVAAATVGLGMWSRPA